VCGGEVVQRADDTVAAIRRRLELYERETSPLMSWYESQDLLCRMDALGTPDEVTDRLTGEIDRRRRG
jgi:adenylate kinase